MVITTKVTRQVLAFIRKQRNKGIYFIYDRLSELEERTIADVLAEIFVKGRRRRCQAMIECAQKRRRS